MKSRMILMALLLGMATGMETYLTYLTVDLFALMYLTFTCKSLYKPLNC